MALSIKIGVSACIVGEHVRYDGRDKLNSVITDAFGEHFTLVPVCPEVGCGLSTPREAMRLEGDPVAPRLMTIRTRIDMTGQMLSFCAEKIDELEKNELCGFIFKERSPSCGLTTVPLFGCDASELSGIGLFAKEVGRRFPMMPVEEAERLNNSRIRKNFIESIFLYRSTLDVLKNQIRGNQLL
jgi:uncharacterized protein YbbK (DUF523 family)